MAKLNISQRKLVARQKRPLLQLSVCDIEELVQARNGSLDGAGVLLGGSSSHDTPEDGPREAQRDVDLGPFGPFVYLSAGSEVLGPEVVVAVFLGQVAEDGAGLPERFAVAVADDGNEAVGVHGEEFGGVVPAISMTDVVLFMGDVEFVQAPEDGLDIGGCATAPDLKHDVDWFVSDVFD